MWGAPFHLVRLQQNTPVDHLTGKGSSAKFIGCHHQESKEEGSSWPKRTVHPAGHFPSQSMPPPSTHHRVQQPPGPRHQILPVFPPAILEDFLFYQSGLGSCPCLHSCKLQRPVQTSSRLCPIQRHSRETSSDYDTMIRYDKCLHAHPNPQPVWPPGCL